LKLLSIQSKRNRIAKVFERRYDYSLETIILYKCNREDVAAVKGFLAFRNLKNALRQAKAFVNSNFDPLDRIFGQRKK
jgi:hypothetical protein